MKKLLICSCAVFFIVGIVITANADTIDLNTWSQQGYPSNGTWTVDAGGATVLQSINGNPTFFVSPDNYINTEFTGKFEVQTSSDDDYIGFVFGYNSPLDTDYDAMDFLLFDWKQGNQGEPPYEGFSLVRVNGSIPSGDYGTTFWQHNDSTVFDVLETDFGTDKGWADHTEYEFTLVYQTNHITIMIDGVTIFDIDGSFPDGRFGFYNYSQSTVRYQGFVEEEAPPVPEPATMLLLGSGLIGFIGFRRRFNKK